MASPFDEHDPPSPFEQSERSERPGETRSDDRDVGVDACNRGKGH